MQVLEESESSDAENENDFKLEEQALLINGDLNDLLDREISKVAPLSMIKEKAPVKGGSTHVSSLTKSPLEAYTD